MSTSLLYNSFKLRGYKYVRTQFLNGETYLTVTENKISMRCAACESKNVVHQGKHNRIFRTLPIGEKAVFIEYAIPRLKCLDCGAIQQMKIEFADPRRSYTKSFEHYVLGLSKLMTIQDVANHLDISWGTVKDIQKRHLERKYSKPKLKKLKQIAVDEISIGNGHQYLTIVLDLESGAVVFTGDGKDAAALIPFWARLKHSRAKIQAVAMDMSAAYFSAVSENLPGATIVFDHFHVIKLFHDKLSDLRRRLYDEATDLLKKKVIKGTRWLLLKNPENLKDDKNERKRLAEALALNAPLATAYYMKEDLRQLWGQPDKASAEEHLDIWLARAETSGISMLIKFAKMLRIHRRGILAYYDHPISTGPLEGTNNKIKTMKRQAYGYRDHEFLKLKIYAIHEAKFALIG